MKRKCKEQLDQSVRITCLNNRLAVLTSNHWPLTDSQHDSNVSDGDKIHSRHSVKKNNILKFI